MKTKGSWLNTQEFLDFYSLEPGGHRRVRSSCMSQRAWRFTSLQLRAHLPLTPGALGIHGRFRKTHSQCHMPVAILDSPRVLERCSTWNPRDRPHFTQRPRRASSQLDDFLGTFPPIGCTSSRFSLSFSTPMSGFSSWRELPATFAPPQA